MKKISLFVISLIAVFSLSAQEVSNKELLKMNIFKVCEVLGISPAYNDRYEKIILPLCREGVIVFNGSLNQYVDIKNEKIESLKEKWNWYYYVGNSAQNIKLIKNLVHNRHLIKNGKLITGAAKKWKVIS